MDGIYDVYVDNTERLFEKVLKSIVTKDIHSDSLGCAVKNTHIRVGDYHLTTFYQAELLFGNLFWTNLLANWLCEKIVDNNSESKDISIIGYEAYTGMLLQITKDKINQLKANNTIDFSCSSVFTFEEKKYDLVTDSESDNHFHPSIDDNIDIGKHIIFVCGVGLTAKTYTRMKETLDSRIGWSKSISEESFYTLIQVFPDDDKRFEEEFQIINTFNPSPDETVRQSVERAKAFNSVHNKIDVRFCISINSEWHKFEDCPLCQEDKKTLIETNGIPIIPMQQIDTAIMPKPNFKTINKKPYLVDALDFSSISSDTLRDNDKQDDREEPFFGIFDLSKLEKQHLNKILRYGHINQNGHHYQYFFKTDVLAKILNDKIEECLIQFREDVKSTASKNIGFAKDEGIYSLDYYAVANSYPNEVFDHSPELKAIVQMRRKLHADLSDDDIIVIVAPNHYGNSLFPLLVNKYIFGNQAQIIGFDSSKMFRSNFLVEYSNYTLFDALSNHKIHYYFVDDEIIDGKTYERTKSLMRSLIENSIFAYSKNDVFEFSGCITLINRQSQKAIASFDNNDKYFYFFSGNVPTLKKYDNLCPLCKESEEYKLSISKTALSATKNYWKREYIRHHWRTLSSAEKDVDQKKKRAIERFKVEEKLYRERKNITHVLQTEFEKFKTYCNTDRYNYDHIISTIKAITKPYLCFKEDVRDNALKLTIDVFNYLVYEDNLNYDNPSIVNSDVAKEKWHLLICVLKALGRMGSNTLLRMDNVIGAYNKLKELFIYSENLNPDDQSASIYCTYVLVGNIKRILNNVDGKNKSLYFSNILYYQIFKSIPVEQDDLWYLYVSLYLESNIDIFKKIEKEQRTHANTSLSALCKSEEAQNDSTELDDRNDQTYEVEEIYEEDSKIIACASLFKRWLEGQLECLESGGDSNNKDFNDCIDCFVQSSVSNKSTNNAISPLFHYMLEKKMPNYIRRNKFDLSDRLVLSPDSYTKLESLGIYRETTRNYDKESASGKGIFYWVKIAEASISDTVSELIELLAQRIAKKDVSQIEAIINTLKGFFYNPCFTLIDKRQFKYTVLQMEDKLEKAKAKDGKIDLTSLKKSTDLLRGIVEVTSQREEKVLLDRGVKSVYIVIDVEKYLETVNAKVKSELMFIRYLQAMLSIDYYNVCLKYLNNKVIDKYTQSASFQKALTMSKASYHDIKKHLMERSAISALDNLKAFGLFSIDQSQEDLLDDNNNQINSELTETNKAVNELIERTKLIVTDNYCLLVNQFIVTLFRWISVSGDNAVPARRRDLFQDAVINPKTLKNGNNVKLIYVYSGDEPESHTITINISIENSLIERRAEFRKLEDEFLLSTTFPGRGILLALVLNTISHSLNHSSDDHKASMNVRMFREKELWCIACEQLSHTDLIADVDRAKEYLEISPALRSDFWGDGITLWSLKKYFDCLNRNRSGNNFIIDCDQDKNEFIVKMRCLYEEVTENEKK